MHGVLMVYGAQHSSLLIMHNLHRNFIRNKEAIASKTFVKFLQPCCKTYYANCSWDLTYPLTNLLKG